MLLEQCAVCKISDTELHFVGDNGAKYCSTNCLHTASKTKCAYTHCHKFIPDIPISGPVSGLKYCSVYCFDDAEFTDLDDQKGCRREGCSSKTTGTIWSFGRGDPNRGNGEYCSDFCFTNDQKNSSALNDRQKELLKIREASVHLYQLERLIGRVQKTDFQAALILAEARTKLIKHNSSYEDAAFLLNIE